MSNSSSSAFLFLGYKLSDYEFTEQFEEDIQDLHENGRDDGEYADLEGIEVTWNENDDGVFMGIGLGSTYNQETIPISLPSFNKDLTKIREVLIPYLNARIVGLDVVSDPVLYLIAT